MRSESVVVLGGGLSGVAAAWSMARQGVGDVTLLERGPALGGLAGSFEEAGHFYPLGYHHILHRDRPLHYFLHQVGAIPEVRWRRIRMLFELDGALHELGSPLGFLRFPMAAADKLRFVRLMLKAFRKRDWSDWVERSAAELIDGWGGPGVREALFEHLGRLKFELPCSELSGAWLGARLYYREGSAALGYIPGTNWTKVLTDGLTRLLAQLGVRIQLQATVSKLHHQDGRVRAAELDGGERVGGDLFVSSIPTEVLLRLLPGDASEGLEDIRYTALISVVCATRQPVEPDFYWMNLASRGRTACGLFLLSSLNPTIGAPGDACLNFVTHLQSRERPLYRLPDGELMEGYRRDFRAVLGFELEPFWHRIVRVPMYSPVFRRGYRNPGVRSRSWRNLYFAGNYRSFPSIASTGTALDSGLEAARAVLEDLGIPDRLLAEGRSHRLPSRPRG